MVSGNLLYGHETVISKFINSVITREEDSSISAEFGAETVKTMIEICERVNKR